MVINRSGNESVGVELSLAMIDYLLTNYEHNEEIQNLLNTTNIFFFPVLNPDGK